LRHDHDRQFRDDDHGDFADFAGFDH